MINHKSLHQFKYLKMLRKNLTTMLFRSNNRLTKKYHHKEIKKHQEIKKEKELEFKVLRKGMKKCNADNKKKSFNHILSKTTF